MYPGSWAKKVPDRPAIVDVESGEAVTYRALDAASNRLAHYFRQHGLRAGDHVALLMANGPRYLEVCWAAQRAGLIYTPINTHLTVAEMAYVVNDCGARMLVADGHFGPVAAELRNHAHIPGVTVDGPLVGFDDFMSLAEALPGTSVPDEAEGVDMIYTSATTGKPKGGTRKLPGLRPGDDNPKLTALYRRLQFREGAVFLVPGAPLYHAAPLRACLATHRLGGTCVIMSSFDPSRALEVIAQHGVTHSQWVPTMFVRMLKLPASERAGADVSTLEVALHTAAACPVTVKQQMMDWWGPVIYEMYGASEGGPVTFIGPDEWLAHPGSVGRSVRGTIHILDDDGIELPCGETGVIYAESGIPITYHGDAEKSQRALNNRGWTTVGDIGYLDDDGYLYLKDRRDDLIVAGGVNIYPREVEDVLIEHPLVRDVAVFGVPHPEYGQEVKAVVELVDGIAATEILSDEMIEFSRGRLASFKCPRSIDFEPELPRAPSGKLYKRRLRDRYWTAENA